MKPSELYSNTTHRKALYNIQSIVNVPSIMQRGLLCFDLASKIPHTSVAMDEVQQLRDQITVPHGMKLHRYANLYFTYHNPMLYKRQDYADDLCILAFSLSVLDIEGCILTDRNATVDIAKFYAPYDGIRQIDFEKVFAKYWTHPDPNEYRNHKHIKCAEILIPRKIPFSYIIGAYVVSQSAKDKMVEEGFTLDISIQPTLFYRKEGN